MITAAEYWAWAAESLKWAHEAATESEREACTKSAEVWLQSALRSERLSKEPDPATANTSGNCPPFNDDYAHQRSTEIAGGVVSRGIGNAMAATQPMTAELAATLKRLAQAAYELEAFQPNLTRAEADLRIAMLTAKLKLLGEPPHTL
jgi:hypothetical protein